ncbi:MAG: hypothetical protein M3024_09795 [Candidatus Dormibacteraeota bacterium]|nr:hypothetical protein [Candidatus Dormibacteraeota bacterium]
MRRASAAELVARVGANGAGPGPDFRIRLLDLRSARRVLTPLVALAVLAVAGFHFAVTSAPSAPSARALPRPSIPQPNEVIVQPGSAGEVEWVATNPGDAAAAGVNAVCSPGQACLELRPPAP